MKPKAKVLTEAQAAEQFDVSEGTLARWRREGKVRHYRQMGRLIKYLPEDIQRNLEDFAAMRPKTTSQNVTEARFG